MITPKRAQPGDLEKLYERIDGYRTAMFTTVSRQGHIHSRPMETQGRAADGDLWFVTSKQSLKVDELAANPNVGVIFFHEDDCSYVSIAGTARLCEDPDLVRAKWKEEWRAWFEAGADSPDICLIKVKVNEAEYWAPERAGLKVMFETARAALTGEHPEIKRPEKLVVGPEKIEPEFIDPA